MGKISGIKGTIIRIVKLTLIPTDFILGLLKNINLQVNQPHFPMQLIKTISFFLLLFSITPLSAQKDYDPDRKYSTSALLEDFAVLYKAFYQEHPAWGVYHPEDSMKLWFAQAKAKIDQPMTELEFRKVLYPLFTKLGCGHTRVERPGSYYKYAKALKKAETLHAFIPFQAQKFGDQLLVTYNHLADSTQLPPGTTILAIDGRSADKIISDIQTMFPSDGYNLTHRDRLINLNFDFRYLFYYGEKENFDLSIRLPDGKTQEIQVPANKVTFPDFNKDIKKRVNAKRPKDKVVLNKKGYQLRILEGQENTAVLKIKGFDGKRGVRFYKKAFRYLAENQIPNLAIDLRDNGGGSGKEALTLVSYFRDDEVSLFGKRKKGKPAVHQHLTAKFGRRVLFPIFMPMAYKSFKDSTHLHMGFSKKPRKKNPYRGRTMLLMNGLTFSSSSIVSSYLREPRLATTIGQECGGGEKSTNAFQMPRLILPNSKVKIKYPMFRIVFDLKKEDKGRGVLPDYPIVYTVEDVMEGKDLEMDIVRAIAGQVNK